VGKFLRFVPCLVLCVTAIASDGGTVGRVRLRGQSPTAGGALVPTVRPTLPSDLSTVWLVPDRASRTAAAGFQPFARAVRALDKGDARQAVGLLPPKLLEGTVFSDYATYYRGVALMQLARHPEAAKVFADLKARHPVGYLAEAAATRAGEVAELQWDAAAAYRLYDTLNAAKTAVPDQFLTRKAAAAKRAGKREETIAAYRSVFYDYPLSDLAAPAAVELIALDENPLRPSSKGTRALAFRRARQLFSARRFAEARIAFENLRPDLSDDDRDLGELLIAECDFHLKRYPQARDGLTTWIDRGDRRAEARYYLASTLRELGDAGAFIARTRELVAAFPDSTWAEEALNSLATHYILIDEDARAIEVFREQYRRFPAGARAERAAWKLGWSAYRAGDDREAIDVFESAATRFTRSDMRPAWVYWSARAHERMRASATALQRYRLVTTDYLNSYYGRLAVVRLKELGHKATPIDAANGNGVSHGGEAASPSKQDPSTSLGAGPSTPLGAGAPVPATQAVIRALLSLELYDAALAELEYARRVWGSTPAIVATLGWVHNRKGNLLLGTQSAKRAYPQFVAAGGEDLPDELLRVFFPVEYWDLIKRHSTARGLDPYVVAALIAQESGYDASIKSAAGAYGLMQIMPATGRRLARTLGIKRFSIPMLLKPDINIRMGTLYFSQLVRQFGGNLPLALASYNAGETRARRWQAEKRSLAREVFIDDIPFPETQGYVKRILSGSEDYRRLYGPPGRASASDSSYAGIISP